MATSFGPASLASGTSLQRSNEDRVLNRIKTGQMSENDEKIAKGAREFEAMLLATWMQQAEQSMATVPGAEDDEDMAGREQMMGLGVQSVATSLAAAGGIGIGSMIAHAMKRMAEKTTQTPVANEQDTKELQIKG